MTFLTALKSNLPKYLIKTAGAAAVGMVAYDSHIVGKMQSDVYAKGKDADAVEKRYNNTRVLSSPSMTTSALKDAVYDLEVNDNTRTFINSGIGYFKGLGSMLIDKVIPLGLGLAALMTKGKSVTSYICGAGLAAYGTLGFFKDILGFGNNDDLNRKF